jgi:hypothetical protein
MQESDYSIEYLCRTIDEVAAGQEVLAIKVEGLERKFDSLFHDVPPYEAAKVDQKLVPRSGSIRRRLELAEYHKAKRIPA